MNLVKNGTLHPYLRDEEALVVENAIRLAIDSIVNVLYGVNSARTHEFQRMVADRDKEIQRLESRLREIEQEQEARRRQRCSGGMPEKATASHSFAGPQGVGDPQTEERSGFEPSCVDADMAAAQQECEMSFSCDLDLSARHGVETCRAIHCSPRTGSVRPSPTVGLFARPPSRVSSQSHESALPSSPGRIGPEHSCTSHSSESSALLEAARNLPASPGSFVVKEEPSDVETFLIKWDMSEEGFREHKESSACQYKENPGEKRKLEDRERRKYGENHHADVEGHLVSEGEHQRNKKKSVPMSELPEEVQKMKRAAWRAASRRYYARKVARQQAKPSPSAPFPNITDSRYSQPVSVLDQRRKMLISELPDESQMLQREAWRAASRRYYARKTTGLQNEPAQYVPLFQNTEPSEESLGPNRGGSHSSSGGIMCS